MTNKLVLAICTAATFTLLAGCTAYDRAASYVQEPVVSDVKVGMTKQQVRAIAGPPSTTATLVHAQGTCDTYAVAPRDGKVQTYFVSYSDTGHVMNKGYQTCSDYDSQPK
ncbi:DNA-binding transcriptional activator OsmE [Serratia quinivorans]|jgi:osmotically inducible lipoprotein OsmE|uniref:Osmotically-inducible lipoprotein OsmE n=3 Tax=Serratia TaxID=613 RepID=A0ABV3UHB7_9GAMM|nr:MULTISPECIES: osmotically-inducible lipoprotein OsmE [Serratia]MCS4267834.1 osmotically inducible lipoprotein OsmE [Serratia sp. BIGb0163]QBX69127.1 osmotically-inducible lipoprotein OsmE [Serratia quinivorans]QGH62878.1 osmotically-inducible lipoprotein OsmE [Serratia proteamaculans]RYM64654.1 transcriptional regulator [Serratia proteamaculans]CAI0713523.1 DNA-binding transcriptional activator OsmE [Serratia quinivorans]